MRIIHVATIGMTALKLLRPQCEYLRAAGHEVGFVFSPGPEAGALRQMGFPVGEVFISRRMEPADAWSVARLARYLRRERPDIVHTHTSKAGVVGRVAARFAGVPHVVHTIHGFPFAAGQAAAKYRAFVGIERWTARLTDLLLSQSAEDVETARRLGIRARRGYPLYLGNGVDTQRFHPEGLTGEERSVRRRAVQLYQGEPVLAIVGRLTAEKGYFELVEALSSLQDIPWSALFIGMDEGAGAEIRRRLESAGLAHRVRILGHRDDVKELLAISDLYTLPSHREGVPRSVIEAQAMGLPAVVTDIRGCREVVVDGETGRIVPPRDAGVLAAALRGLLADEGMRRRMGVAARKRAEEQFDERLVFARLARAYELLADRKAVVG